MAKTNIKLNNTMAVVKVTDTQTIDLDVDIKTTAETIAATGVVVNIIGMDFTGAAGSTITLVRNGITIATIAPEHSYQIKFEEFADNIQNTQDIVVTITGNANIWLKLRKVSGFISGNTVDQLGSHGTEAQ